MTDISTGARGGRAIVIGGGLTGMLAAWALAEVMDEVTVLERDREPTGPDFRPGVPQGRHAHAFMEGGQRALEELLPGIIDELVEAGATRTKLPAELLWLDYAGWNDRGTAIRGGAGSFLTCTRPMLDWIVRSRVLKSPRITVRHGVTVSALLCSEDAVRGVVAQEKGGEPEELKAPLVVDASGRGSNAPRWLRELGYPEPKEELIDSGMAYASRLLHRTPESEKESFNVVMIQPVLSTPRFGLLIPVEDNRWLVALGGLRGYEPPTESDDWTQFAKELRSPMIYKMIENAEPATNVFGFRNTQNRRRYYEKLSRRPDGFLVLGDAACTFNPVYGQGMSVACFEGLALRKLLAKHGAGKGMTRKAQKMVARTIRNPWTMATSEDRRYPTTVGGGRPNALERMLDWYVKRVSAEALVNPVAGKAFFSVVMLLEPPTHLFRPGVVLAALRRRGASITVPEPVLAGAQTDDEGPGVPSGNR
ncbi:hypothetical protein AA958_08060 [Streptomyces sp. CNQ-509]|uniref:FAD-dependent oxidoreductase n=1 Tax=unclassified Streptomyces TaxID=2593676 RepID=UPI00062E0018|nr:FAD-dependent monooxygenase [Streptomyces sp. CNQ-509]AKH82193.1 hypothetical protein AA958_08060 [Streptomyces sp. CNQ-509]